MALKADGSLWRWGNTSGLTPVSSPVQVVPASGSPKFVVPFASNTTVGALAQDGTIWAVGDNTQGQLATGNLTNLTTLQELTFVGSNTWQGGDGTTKHRFGRNADQYSIMVPVYQGAPCPVKLGANAAVNGYGAQPTTQLVTGTTGNVSSFYPVVCKIGWMA